MKPVEKRATRRSTAVEYVAHMDANTAGTLFRVKLRRVTIVGGSVVDTSGGQTRWMESRQAARDQAYRLADQENEVERLKWYRAIDTMVDFR